MPPTGTCAPDSAGSILAARLEAHPKRAARSILIDPATRAGLDTSVATEAIGPVSFKGKAAAVDVFAVPAPPA